MMSLLRAGLRELGQIFRLIILLLFAGACIATVLVLFADHHQALELLSHFRLQFLMTLVITGLVLTITATPRFLWALIPLMVICAWPIIPYYLPQAKPVHQGNMFKLLNANVLIENEHYDALGKLIQQENPDIVTLEEIDAYWAAALKPYMRQYPYQKVIPQNNAFGIALYSKLPLTDTQVKFFGKEYGGRFFPSIVSNVHVGSHVFTIVATHPLPPMAGFSVRNSQLADLAVQSASFGNNLIVIGDLNISPWSPYFERFIQQTGLRDSQLGFGVQPSWPADKPLIRIPIDHVLVSEQFVVLKRELGPDIGSDHLPVIVELSLK